jgi:hypothetical protein
MVSACHLLDSVKWNGQKSTHYSADAEEEGSILSVSRRSVNGSQNVRLSDDLRAFFTRHEIQTID